MFNLELLCAYEKHLPRGYEGLAAWCVDVEGGREVLYTAYDDMFVAKIDLSDVEVCLRGKELCITILVCFRQLMLRHSVDIRQVATL